jgi:hypothetical protein
MALVAMRTFWEYMDDDASAPRARLRSYSDSWVQEVGDEPLQAPPEKWSFDDDSTTASKADGCCLSDSEHESLCEVLESDTEDEPEDASMRPSREPARTTLILKNVPNSSSCRDRVCSLLERESFANLFDFVYVPFNFKVMSPFGFAVVNFVDQQVAERARQHFSGFLWSTVDHCSELEACWSYSEQQGLQSCVRRLVDCDIMHFAVPDFCKPALLQGGSRIAFPSPSRSLNLPKELRRRGVKSALIE